jgi:hypothetical protein
VTPALPGGFLSNKAQGTTTTHARFPSTRKAIRQSYSLISQRVRGAKARIPSPLPAETTEAAMPRCSANHLMASTVSGT